MRNFKRQASKFIGTGLFAIILLGSITSCSQHGCPNKITEKPQQEQTEENS